MSAIHVDISPPSGRESGDGRRQRRRACLSSSAGHTLTFVIPGTTKIYRDAQGDGSLLRVSVGKLGKLREETDLLVDQIRTISNQRLMGDKPITELSSAHLKRVEDALRILTSE